MCFVAFPKQTAITSLQNTNLLVFSAKAVSIFCELGQQFKKYLVRDTRASKNSNSLSTRKLLREITYEEFNKKRSSFFVALTG